MSVLVNVGQTSQTLRASSTGYPCELHRDTLCCICARLSSQCEDSLPLRQGIDGCRDVTLFGSFENGKVSSPSRVRLPAHPSCDTFPRRSVTGTPGKRAPPIFFSGLFKTVRSRVSASPSPPRVVRRYSTGVFDRLYSFSTGQ